MRFVVAGFIWLVIAIALGASGATQRIKPPGPQLIIAGLVIALLAAYAIGARFREWLRELDIRALIALHLTRFVGFYFVYLYKKGQLPYAFAVPAGGVTSRLRPSRLCYLPAGRGLDATVAHYCFGMCLVCSTFFLSSPMRQDKD